MFRHLTMAVFRLVNENKYLLPPHCIQTTQFEYSCLLGSNPSGEYNKRSILQYIRGISSQW